MSTETTQEARVRIHLAALMAERNITITALADEVGLSVSQLSRLKNGDVAFIRLETMTALCRELKCRPGDLLTYS